MNIYGMKNVRVEDTSNGTFIVRADTDRFGVQEIMFESFSFDDVFHYLFDNDIPTDTVQFNAERLIQRIINTSYLFDVYIVEYPFLIIQRKYGPNSLTQAERDFMRHNNDSAMETCYKDGFFKGGILRVEYISSGRETE